MQKLKKCLSVAMMAAVSFSAAAFCDFANSDEFAEICSNGQTSLFDGLGNDNSTAATYGVSLAEKQSSDGNCLSAMAETAVYSDGTNALISDASETAGKEVEYSVPSWTFGEVPSINAPRLQHGDEFFLAQGLQPNGYTLVCGGTTIVAEGNAADGWNPYLPDGAHDIATFTLTRTYNGVSELIAENELRSNWAKYFNEYMPVGQYSLVFDVATVSISNHTHWWNGDRHEEDANPSIVYQGFRRSFPFEVYAGTFTIADSDFNDYNKNDAPYEVDIANFAGGDYSSFFRPASEATFSPVVTKEDVKTDGASTHWATVADQYYDDAPAMHYNLARMYNNSYLAMTADWSGYVNAPSTYKVFYMATMKNYQTAPLMTDERYEKFFNVIVYQTVALPTLSRTQFVYTGRELTADVSAEIPLSERILYTVTGNKGTNADHYTAVFELIDKVHYKWENDAEECSIGFEVSKAPVIVPVLAQRVFTGRAQTADITIPTDFRNEAVFTVIHGAQNADGKYTNAKTYEITLRLKDAANYVWVDAEGAVVPAVNGETTIDFIINKSVDTWAAPVYLSSWSFGTYSKTVNAIAGAAASGRTVYYTVYDSDGIIYGGLGEFTLDGDYADTLAELPRGEYYIGAYIPEADNYLALSSDRVRFDVLIGHNEWEETPNIIRWRYGEYDPEINRQYGQAMHGETTFWFYQLDQSGERIGDGRAAMSEFADDGDFGRIPSGTYEMVVSADGGENYASLNESIAFNILQGINYWEETPNIERWVYGNTRGEITGRAKYGEPIFTVTTLDGIEVYNSETEKDELSTLRPGTYFMRAWVEETSNYTGLNNHEVEFKVFGTENNVWLVLPAIQGWTEGETPNAPQASAAEGVVSFTYRTAEGEFLGATVPTLAGDYFLIAYVEPYGNFNELKSEVRFPIAPRVLKINSWTVAPNIQGWTEGETANTPVGEAFVGEVSFLYRTAEGTVLNAAPTVAGEYVLVASVSLEGYEEMTAEVCFTIAVRVLKINVWTVVPNIQGWTEGETASEPVGQAKAGETQFIYRTAAGDPLTGKPTVAGDYILTATVLADGYETLTAEIAFKVLRALVAIDGSVTDSEGNVVTVKIDNVESGVKVVFAVITEDDEASRYRKSEESLSRAGYSVGAIYNIGLLDSADKSVQPNGPVRVTVSIPKELVGREGLQVAYVSEDGSIELLGGTVADGKITFTTSHFSTFCFVWEDGSSASETVLLVFLIIFIVLFVGAVSAGVWYFLRVKKADATKNSDEQANTAAEADSELKNKARTNNNPSPADEE